MEYADDLPRLTSWPDSRKAAHAALNKLRPLLPKEERGNGLELGIYALVDRKHECPNNLLKMDGWWVAGGGNVTMNRRFQEFEREKAGRLARFIHQVNPHIVSARQADWDRRWDQYMGAIRVRYYVPEFGDEPTSIIFSASGLFELADEAFLVEFARRAPWRMAEPDILRRIVDLSNNELGRKLLLAA